MVIEYDWNEHAQATIAHSALRGSQITSTLQSNVSVPGMLTKVHQLVVSDAQAVQAEQILSQRGVMGRVK